ncbi:MAG: fibronectin type III domain-containing protein, partial [Planctomycetota bacterium]
MCKKSIRLISFVLVLSLAGMGWSGVSKPVPADGTVHKETWISLGWTAGGAAASFDVYFGDNLDDVENGTGEAPRGNQATTSFLAGFVGFPFPDGLVPGKTYYWRVDEVQTDGTIQTGPVWSFSILSNEAVDPDPADGAQIADANDVTLSWSPGFGAKLHTVYFGDNYDDVDAATGGTAQAATTYSAGALELDKVYYWRVDEFDVLTTHKGHVWSFTTPGAVGNPQPPNGATDVQMNKILSWTPADSAASHELYFGTDKETVRTAGTGSPEYVGHNALGAESYDPGLLEPDAVYYWRVDEVDSQGNVSKGPIWSFATGDILVVDHFESYDDVDPLPGELGLNRIFDKWIDGFEITTNGALVGNDLPPYAETKIVRSGLQSMPLLYQNTDGVTYSEAELTLSNLRDWTVKDVNTLTLSFWGKPSNDAEPMYVTLNGSPPIYRENPNASQVPIWMVWNIDLQLFADLGVDLTNVNKIAI